MKDHDAGVNFENARANIERQRQQQVVGGADDNIANGAVKATLSSAVKQELDRFADQPRDEVAQQPDNAERADNQQQPSQLDSQYFWKVLQHPFVSHVDGQSVQSCQKYEGTATAVCAFHRTFRMT